MTKLLKKKIKKLEELKLAETKISNIRRIKSEIERKLGRVEGMIEIEENRKEEKTETVVMSSEEIKILDEVNYSIDEALIEEDSQKIKDILKSIKDILNKFNKNQDDNKINNILIQIEKFEKNRRRDFDRNEEDRN